MYQWVDDNIYNRIVNKDNAHVLWKKLEELYARKMGDNKLYVVQKLMNLRYKDGTSITDHLNEMQEILSQLIAIKIFFDDKVQALMLLGSLPDSWKTFRVFVNNAPGDRAFSMDFAKVAC